MRERVLPGRRYSSALIAAGSCALLACDGNAPGERGPAPGDTAGATSPPPLARDSRPTAPPDAPSNGSRAEDPYADPPAVLALVDSSVRFDSATTIRRTDLLRCDELARYFVVERQSRDEPGADVFVRPKSDELTANTGASLRCVTDSLPGDYVARNEWAEYYLGMRGDWLFLDSGTGPSRGLSVHDVAARKKVAAIGGADGVGWRDSVTYVLWIEKGEQPRERCPMIPESLGAGLDSLFALDLRTGSLTPLGHARCAPRQ